MKIGTLTFHTAHNYGAMLQAYALVYYLKQQGHDTEIIDYKAEFNEKRFAKKTISHFLNIREIYNIIFRNGYQKPCPEAFKDFYDNYLIKSTRSYSKDELKLAGTKYDRIVAGSDQVWNLACTDGDDAYFLPFVSDDKRYSYAASMGINQIPEPQKERLTDYLQHFNCISVREKEAVGIVKSLTGKEAVQTIDPTLLLTKEQWAEIADYSRCPSDKYLLIYLMSEDRELLTFAERYAKAHYLKIVYISQRLFKRINASYLKDVTPNQWLGLFLNAEVIVTNSFHGSVFGINFGKDLFIKFIHRSIANSRLQTLVDDYNLSGHLLKNDHDFVGQEKVDIDEISDALKKYRKLSYEYISNYLLK